MDRPTAGRVNLQAAGGTTKYTKYTKTERVPVEAGFTESLTVAVAAITSFFVCFVYFVVITTEFRVNFRTRFRPAVWVHSAPE